ncbi:MAG: DUF4867 family protein [Lachnospiraceae bacterium]|nr:DUF4867 family protein [Lachnospiraceae bacterium]
MQIQKVTDSSFKKYGRILTADYDVAELIQEMGKTPCPDDVIYVPSDPAIEKLPIMKAFTDSLYGGLPIQIGYCNGHNNLLNAVEYHRSSEINVACTDLILLIGMQQDIEEDFTYDTNKIEAFLVPAGTMIEVYATTLHYAPCSVDGQGFRCVVVLPKDTNLDLVVKPEGAKEDKLLVARNKWLIGHADAKIDGAFNGLKGENICVD